MILFLRSWSWLVFLCLESFCAIGLSAAWNGEWRQGAEGEVREKAGRHYFLCPAEDTWHPWDPWDPEWRYSERVILQTPLYQKPFTHLFLCQFLKPSLYSSLVEHWPNDKLFGDLPVPRSQKFLAHSQRRVVGVKALATRNDTHADAAEVWKRLEAVLTHPRVAAALEKRFGLHQVNMTKSEVLVHHKHFSIGIHPDSPSKRAVVMLYFPEVGMEEQQALHFGTNTHAASEEALGAQDKFSKAKPKVFARYPFLPNSAYAMKIGTKSFHSVTSLPPRIGSRRTVSALFS